MDLKTVTPEKIRDGIFALNTRRFGTVAEILVKILANADWGEDLSHDLTEKQSGRRIEVKFSRALKANNETIRQETILQNIINADDSSRMFKSTEWNENKFDCNIQQIKKKQFDILYYGVFFSDKVVIFKIAPSQIGNKIKYSDKQHRGNKGEGQFHLNNDTYQFHLDNYFEKELTYKEILNILLELHKEGKIDYNNLILIFSMIIQAIISFGSHPDVLNI